MTEIAAVIPAEAWATVWDNAGDAKAEVVINTARNIGQEAECLAGLMLSIRRMIEALRSKR